MSVPSLTFFKACPRCGCTKPRTHRFFYVHDNGRVESRCRRCAILKNREWVARNGEKRKADYKRWAEANRDKLAANFARWHAANKETHNERVARYRVRNLAYFAAKQRNRKALEYGAPGAHTALDIREMYESQRGVCAYCEEPLAGVFHVDHMEPLSRGGSNDWSNLAVACAACNLSKGARTAEEFWAVLIERG